MLRPRDLAESTARSDLEHELTDAPTAPQFTAAPQPEHPWNTAHEEPLRHGRFSHLYRHGQQIEMFRLRILPLLIERRRADRQLHFRGLGAGTGEEIAAIPGVIIEEFEKHAAWGSVEDWTVIVHGIEINQTRVTEALNRLTGQRPLVFNSEFSAADPITYRTRVGSLLSALNGHREWVARN